MPELGVHVFPVPPPTPPCDCGVPQDGEVQVLSLDSRQLVAKLSLQSQYDRVTFASVFPGEPYVLLGSTGGHLRVATLLGPNQQPVAGGMHVASVALAQYFVAAERLRFSSPVTCLAVVSLPGGQHLVAAADEKGTISVWDLRHALHHSQPSVCTEWGSG